MKSASSTPMTLRQRAFYLAGWGHGTVATVLAFLVVAFLFPGKACAHELNLHAVSLHEKGGYEAVTPGLTVVFDESFAGINTVGILRNSIKRTSILVGHTWTSGRWALSAGGITGYPHAAVSPYIVPSVKVGPVRAMYIHKKPDEPDSSRALSFAYTKLF